MASEAWALTLGISGNPDSQTSCSRAIARVSKGLELAIAALILSVDDAVIVGI
ncbi:hypothetical protein [Lyngbya sp. CCY1209]|uniref:hypothetical protein n=1 Tax=Lyngbya sp. CCY1209 TaxID=2886103 RepID=UPI002D207EEE|nr:hypothetical protein [Lyngbya sp. CCY1209]MEB3885658.1 hypothetical protein [Lyngbya sp. CCY1209]